MHLTAKLIRQSLSYDPETGHFHWLVDRRGGGATKGDRAGFLSARDGLVIRLLGKAWPASKIAWAHVHGFVPEKQVRILNGDNTDIRLANLRISGEIVKHPTAEQMREVIDYDPVRGLLSWKKSPAKHIPAGTPIGRVDRNGYVYIAVFGGSYVAQRIAWLIHYGRWPERMLRFKNRNKRDIRIDNLDYGEFDASTPEGRREYDKVARQRQRDTFRNQELKKKFGITLAQYRLMLAEQNGVCAICSQPETAVRAGKIKFLAIDHCHSTGKVRGLLCQSCNQAIGHLNDDTARLRAAIEYIERHKAAPADAPNVVPFAKKEPA